MFTARSPSCWLLGTLVLLMTIAVPPLWPQERALLGCIYHLLSLLKVKSISSLLWSASLKFACSESLSKYPNWGVLGDTTPWETSSTANKDLFSDTSSGKLYADSVFLPILNVSISCRDVCVLAQMLFCGTLLLFISEIWLELCELTVSYGLVRIGKE